jgi:cytochrome c oxidase cbb3-type subunit IV
MYKEVLSGIHNISIYPVISFIVFFIFFLLMSFWVLKSRKEDFDGVSQIPFHENNI